ncbi:hypothetical protein ACFPER_06605 [Agromyces aurantiacus]|uniref:Uncharacterized protein n=1 Tax=Agromyces aurantiacus TaxID=165814 RepID=A0ABV9R5A9_9MICO|nr:hypothetical protein [Agromyces aurantiacus]MBM7503135.1 hypothetical protein [Agromyces aurantiacus]
MRKTMGLLAAAGALVLGSLSAAGPAVAQVEGDWNSVTKVMVNKLGGVNVSGEVSCAGAYDRLVSGELLYDTGEGWAPVPFTDGDLVILNANSDNYTVSQPAGRKAMIQVTHGSSRMSPCYATTTTTPDGHTIPPWAACAPEGTPCRWETDAYAYDHEANGPLFDYSSGGKFKTGLVNVSAQSIGLFVQILHEDQTWDMYFIEEGSYAMTSTALKAVSSR